MPKYDIAAYGEALIDFVSLESGRKDKVLIEGNPGGAPANVLACAAKLGCKTAMMGKVGNDAFGVFLKHVMDDAGIDTEAMVLSGTEPTTLAFVSLDENGDRAFSFYRNQTADVMMRAEELDLGRIREASIFHFGSVSMTAEPSRGTTLRAAGYAKENGVLVSFDPNLRERLWSDLDEAKKYIREGLSVSDLVKLSEEELVFLTGEQDMEAGIDRIYAEFPLSLLIVTCGEKGCACKWNGEMLYSPAYDVPCVDTTGAGDTFWGTTLSCIVQGKTDVRNMSRDELKEILAMANAAGSLATTAKGAIPAMPGRQQIEDCVKNIPELIK